jgi:hypothetical protein
MGKGGVYGSYVLIKLTKGTSKKYPAGAGAANESAPAGTGKASVSKKSPLVYMKEPVAKFLGFPKISPADELALSRKTVKTTINGKDVTRKVLTKSGATGASRSVTIRFKRLEDIGGKKVASVKVAVPSSHSFGDMVDELINCPAAAKIAQIVSFSGRTISYDTPYKPQLVGTGKNKALPSG